MIFFFKTLSAHCFLKIELVPQFRQYLNVWHIQNLEQPFLIWASNCRVKFWRSPKNFKIQNFFLKILNLNLERIFPQKRLMIRIYKWLQKAFSKWLMGSISITYLNLVLSPDFQRYNWPAWGVAKHPPSIGDNRPVEIQPFHELKPFPGVPEESFSIKSPIQTLDGLI